MKIYNLLIPMIILAITVDGYCQNTNAREDQYKPRVIISTDFPPREVAQAIYKVQQTRSPEEVQEFISNLRIFQIGLGDDPGQDGSGQWMFDNSPNLFLISSLDTYPLFLTNILIIIL